MKRELPLYPEESYGFEGYDPSSLMDETEKLRNLITKRGTLELLIPLCCSIDHFLILTNKSKLTSTRFH